MTIDDNNSTTERGVGPRADVPLDELERELPVCVEILGDSIETGYATIHDPEYLEPAGEYIDMTLGDALDVADDFCCDCFTRAMVDGIVAADG